jgi:CHASE3 domain sensor protein
MDPKTQSIVNSYVGVISLLVSAVLAFYTFFVRSEDKSTESFEKEVQYRAKTKKDIQDIKDLHKSELQAHKNTFQGHLLSNQRIILELTNKITTMSIGFDNLKRQNEYLHSQMILGDAAVKAECENKYKIK